VEQNLELSGFSAAQRLQIIETLPQWRQPIAAHPREQAAIRNRGVFLVTSALPRYRGPMNTPVWKPPAFLVVLAAMTFVALAPAQASETAARQLFERYVALGHAYDPSLADLYADDALIRNKRTYPTGEIRELTMPAAKYKALIRSAMPLAKARGDRNTFSDVSYAAEGDRVRIRASRFSELKKYTSPISLLVGPSANGTWLIYEEVSESRP
jgi:hypothetical protein